MDEAIHCFQKLGLTQYESAAFSALLSKHDANAQQVAEIANIPYTKIYSTLSSLERLGLLKTTLERPKKYGPVSPEIALQILLKHKEDELNFLKQKIDIGALNKLYKHGERFGQSSDIIYLPTKETVWDMVNETIKTSKKNLKIVALKEVWAMYLKDSSLIKAALNRLKNGVITSKNIIPSDLKFDFQYMNPNFLEYFFIPTWERRIINSKKIFYNIMIKDDTQVGMSFHNPTTNEITSGIIIQNKSVVNGMVDYFNMLWNESKSLPQHIFNEIRGILNK